MLREITEETKMDKAFSKGEGVQKIWDNFTRDYNKFRKELKKAGVGVMVLSELDDLEYNMYELLGVK